MARERFFLDTAFIQAVLNRRDHLHDRARAFLPRVSGAVEVWVTEAVLIEVGNALSAVNREVAAQFILDAYRTPNMRVVTVDTALLENALKLYTDRSDKSWGLTDCISFVVMREQSLTDALTADSHFLQAGYRALLLEKS